MGLTILGALLSLGLLVWVAPPGQVVDQISDMKLSWVLIAVGLELASCACYPLIFRHFFPEPPAGVSRRVAWMAVGAGALLPGGNIASAGATGLLLRRHGIGARRLIERCAALLCLLTLFGFWVNGLAGTLLLVHVPGGPHDLWHTGGPILVSIAVLGGATSIMIFGRRPGTRAPRFLRAVAAALDDAWLQARTGHWRLLGAAGFLLLDMSALWAACAATGHSIGPLAVILAYCIGYLATLIPIPAGIGVLDTGLAGTLVLYGFSPTASVGAVLVYHAIAIWVPALGGLTAWLPTRLRAHESGRLEPVLAPSEVAGNAAEPGLGRAPGETAPVALPALPWLGIAGAGNPDRPA